MPRRKHYYTVYLNKTDEIIATGTAEQCAKAMACSLNTFYCTVHRVLRGRNKKYAIVRGREG